MDIAIAIIVIGVVAPIPVFVGARRVTDTYASMLLAVVVFLVCLLVAIGFMIGDFLLNFIWRSY